MCFVYFQNLLNPCLGRTTLKFISETWYLSNMAKTASISSWSGIEEEKDTLAEILNLNVDADADAEGYLTKITHKIILFKVDLRGLS